MATGEVVEGIRGGLWMTGVSMSIALTGFLYWVAVARLAGLHSLGVAASIVSGAGLALSIIGSGLGLAIISGLSRGIVGLRGLLAYSLLVSLAAGMAAFMLALPFPGYSPLAFMLASAGLMSSCITTMLVSFKMFKEYFIAGFSASLSKLVVGLVLVLSGFGVVGILLGYLAPSVVALAVAVLVLLIHHPLRGIDPEGGVASIARLHAANYPYGFSQQLALMLTVYGYAVLGGAAVDVGRLYILMMIEAVLVSFSSTTSTALIPIAGEEDCRKTYPEAYRVTAFVSLVAASLLLLAPTQILSLISPRLASSSRLLPLLLLSMTPMMHVQMVVAWLNRVSDERGVLVIGVVRAASLLALLYLLGWLGLPGIVAAWCIANLSAALLGAVYTSTLSLLARLLAVNMVLLAAYLPLVARLALPVLVLASSRLLGVGRVSEILLVARRLMGARS